jgi:2,3-bisphosphoglycerate-independent phosphoglycerate mutase
MKLLLKAMFGSIDESGNLVEKDIRDSDCEYLAEAIGCIEIDGVKFTAAFGQTLDIAMEGDGLSADVTPNYHERISVVKQIAHRSTEAKFTSSVLNRFIRKAYKMLSSEPCNRGKRYPPNMILIREIEEISG